MMHSPHTQSNKPNSVLGRDYNLNEPYSSVKTSTRVIGKMSIWTFNEVYIHKYFLKWWAIFIKESINNFLFKLPNQSFHKFIF